MISNPALMGLIGVFIGALFSIVISFMNNKHSLKVLYIQEEQRVKEALRNDKKAAYFDFLLIQQKLSTHNLASLIGNKEFQKKSNEEITYLNEKLKVEISLYFSEELKKDAYKVLGMSNPTSQKEAEKFNALRNDLMDKIIEEMKKDLYM